MITPGAGSWLRVRDAVFLFVGMGCEPRSLPGQMIDSDGTEWQVRYLYNPDNGNYVSMSDLGPDDSIGPDEIESWERRLGMKIPPPPPDEWWNKPPDSPSAE